jgi:aryl-alcohol dehydrogenase-like predicted oxidoreductase
MNFTGTYGPASDQASAVEVIRRAYDRGITFFDTAQAYGAFASS